MSPCFLKLADFNFSAIVCPLVAGRQLTGRLEGSTSSASSPSDGSALCENSESHSHRQGAHLTSPLVEPLSTENV